MKLRHIFVLYYLFVLKLRNTLFGFIDLIKCLDFMKKGTTCTYRYTLFWIYLYVHIFISILVVLVNTGSYIISIG